MYREEGTPDPLQWQVFIDDPNRERQLVVEQYDDGSAYICFTDNRDGGITDGIAVSRKDMAKLKAAFDNKYTDGTEWGKEMELKYGSNPFDIWP